MKQIAPGTYVVAVSGGVDSVVLLHRLLANKDLDLIVAHVDHGIRGKQSHEDAMFVSALAESCELPFEVTELHLKSGTSEAEARQKRYAFLESVRQKHAAKAIITAHHKDDVIETAIINILRGTKRLGLSSLKDRETIIRPLLDTTKDKIIEYAEDNNLEWREDATNSDTVYLRNYIRKQFTPRLSTSQKAQLNDMISNASEQNDAIDEALKNILSEHTQHAQNELSIDRSWFIMQPEELRKELLAHMFRGLRQAVEIDSKQLTYIDLLIRIARAGTEHQLSKDVDVHFQDAKVLVRTKTSSR